MRSHATLIVLCLSLSATFALAQELQPAGEDTLAKLRGAWVRDKVLSSGKEVPSEKFPFELHFEGGRLTFKFVGPVQGKDRVHDVKLDHSKEPFHMDITRLNRGRDATIRAIYKLDGDRLLICSLRDANGQPAKERPTSFESSEAVRSELIILKRKARADD